MHAEDNFVDISPQNDGQLKKIVVRKGDYTKTKPQPGDFAEVSWQIRSLNGTLLHDSEMLEGEVKTMIFVLGEEESELPLGWDIALLGMLEGEIARLQMSAEMGFGEKGLLTYVPPNSSIICDLTLHQVIPPMEKAYESMGEDENIRDELVEKIQTRHIPFASEENEAVPVGPPIKPTKDAKFFDPKKHKLNPNQKVLGKGDGHNWEENAQNIDIELPLPAYCLGKKDLHINIK